jgi:hypothetical protein
MTPMSIFLSYAGNSMALPEGESFVGRGLACRMRFNDAAMSRKHVSLMVKEGVVVVTDLGSKNGTELNGLPLTGPRQARHGDVLQIGTRQLKILVGVDDDEESITLTPERAVQKQDTRHETQEIRIQCCPECAEEVSAYDDECRACGYTWGDFRPQARTKAAPVEGLQGLQTRRTQERRGDPRHKVHLPVVYTSESLSFESHALDLSRSGVFLRSQLLEPVETQCSITMLVDGAPALTLAGKVCRVVDANPSEEQPLGLGIHFLAMSAAEQEWLEQVLLLAAGET